MSREKAFYALAIMVYAGSSIAFLVTTFFRQPMIHGICVGLMFASFISHGVGGRSPLGVRIQAFGLLVPLALLGSLLAAGAALLAKDLGPRLAWGCGSWLLAFVTTLGWPQLARLARTLGAVITESFPRWLRFTDRCSGALVVVSQVLLAGSFFESGRITFARATLALVFVSLGVAAGLYMLIFPSPHPMVLMISTLAVVMLGRTVSHLLHLDCTLVSTLGSILALIAAVYHFRAWCRADLAADGTPS